MTVAVKEIGTCCAKFMSAQGPNTPVTGDVNCAFMDASTNVGKSREKLEAQKKFLTHFKTHPVGHEYGRLCDECSFFLSGASLRNAIAASSAQSVQEISARFQRTVAENIEWIEKQPK